jgi:acetate kinase
MYFYRIRKYIGAYAAVLNGLDILVLTGGIGENCRKLLTGICSGLEYLGIELKDDPQVLPGQEKIVSTEKSRVKVLVIPTNEELAIAEETWNLLTDRK